MDITAVAEAKRQKNKKVGGRYPPLEFDINIELAMSSDKGVLEAVAKSLRKKVGSTSISYTPAPAWSSALVHHEEEVAGGELQDFGIDEEDVNGEEEGTDTVDETQMKHEGEDD